MKNDILTIGSAVRDIFLFLDSSDALVIDNPKQELTRKRLIGLEYGAKIRVKDSEFALGGGSLNSAVTFSRLGFKASVCACLGEDENGENISNMLEKEKVSIQNIQKSKDKKTGFSVLIVPGDYGDRVILVERGANDDFLFKSGKAKVNWYYTTALSGDNWETSLDNILNSVKENKIKWAWNPGGQQLEKGVGALGRYLKNCFLLNINRDEALELVSAEKDDKVDNPKILLENLLSWGPEMVVITDGAEGVYYADKNQMIFMEADKSIESVEATGAGDSFGSAFVAGLMETNCKNIPYALDLGISNSESVIRSVGAQFGIIRKSNLKEKTNNPNHKLHKIT